MNGYTISMTIFNSYVELPEGNIYIHTHVVMYLRIYIMYIYIYIYIYVCCNVALP